MWNIYSLNNRNKPIHININDYKLIPLPWFLQRGWQFYPLLRFCPIGANVHPVKRVKTRPYCCENPSDFRDAHPGLRITGFKVWTNNFIIMSLSQHNSGTEKNIQKDFLRDHLLCDSTKTSSSIKLNCLRKGRSPFK